MKPRQAGHAKKKKAPARKPLIPVKGKIGKPGKSSRHSKSKIKLIGEATTNAYEAPVTERANFKPLALKVNSKPANFEQEMSYKVKEIQKAKQMRQNHEKPQKNRPDGFDVKSKRNRKPFIAQARFKQKKKETDGQFIRRVNQAAEVALNKSKMERKFKVALDDNGQAITKKKKKSNKKKNSRIAEKKKIKKLVTVVKKEEKKSDFHHLQDKVMFGERVSAPPTLTAKPKKAEAFKNKNISSLKLTEKLQGDLQPGLSSKKKHAKLAPSQQRRLDEERERAIQMYRQIKTKEHQAKSEGKAPPRSDL